MNDEYIHPICKYCLEGLTDNNGVWIDDNTEGDVCGSHSVADDLSESEVNTNQPHIPGTVYVNVYDTTMEYGGPEEGGWWYNRLVCLNSIPVQDINTASDLIELLKRCYPNNNPRPYTSVLNGQKYDIWLEREERQSETKRRPHYE